MTDPSTTGADGLPFVAPWRTGGLTSLACGCAIVRPSPAVIGLALEFATGWIALVLLSALIYLAPILCLPFYSLRAGSGVGTVFASVAVATRAFSLHRFVDRRTDAMAAMVTSITAVLRNRRVMALWAPMTL